MIKYSAVCSHRLDPVKDCAIESSEEIGFTHNLLQPLYHHDCQYLVGVLPKPSPTSPPGNPSIHAILSGQPTLFSRVNLASSLRLKLGFPGNQFSELSRLFSPRSYKIIIDLGNNTHILFLEINTKKLFFYFLGKKSLK